jgi:hypothetical protein
MTKSFSTALFTATIVAAGLAAIAQPAAAQSTPSSTGLTRAEVRAELIRARAAGELVYWNDGVQFSQGHAQGPARTRAEVLAELEAARASGELLRSQRDNYVPPSTGVSKTRQQVNAETAEARRLGLLGHEGDGPVVATPEQLARVEAAGLRARAEAMAAADAQRPML